MADPMEVLREDIEDALKEYSELDLLVELIQNALDALDYRRYLAICEAAGVSATDPETVRRWNSAVIHVIAEDYRAYADCTSAVERANLYKSWLDEQGRRGAWWNELGSEFDTDAGFLADAADEVRARLAITVRTGQSAWIEVEDNGLGMVDIPGCFQHKSSAKRPRSSAPRRLGTRGSHGWGLTAVLGMSDLVEVVSRTGGDGLSGCRFANYASFASGAVNQPQNQALDLSGADGGVFSDRLREKEGETGTHVRVRLTQFDERTLLGYTLQNYSHELLEYLLRLYTPIGQVNDYVLHPAFHCLRSSDLVVHLRSADDGGALSSLHNVRFDYLRLGELPGFSQVTFDNYVNTGWPSNVSVHTVHRAKKGEHVYLSAAEIQGAESVIGAEKLLDERRLIPAFVDASDTRVAAVPRGFQLALSGGMRAEHLARPPVGNMAMLRGIVLAETARPTLGRKYVMDQREAIPKAARDHQNAYEDVRSKVRPQAVPPVATPAQARWRREFFDGVIADHQHGPPLSRDLRTWATDDSREARVMLVFGELLAKGYFKGIRVLRVHLQDRYDFAYLLTSDLTSEDIPNTSVAEKLAQAGYAEKKAKKYHMYGVGEFKAVGQDVFDDFDPTTPRKSPDTLDLLVCWSFSEQQVDAQSWSVEEATTLTSEVPGQTHLWIPGGDDFKRSRPLPIISLATVIEAEVEAGALAPPPEPWPASLPDNYL